MLVSLMMGSASAFSLVHTRSMVPHALLPGHLAGSMAGVSRTAMLAAPAETFSCTWLATADNKNESFISFSENHYLAMLADERRTSLYCEAIQQRLAKHPPGTLTVLDIGTGPYAVLALTAARAGAKKVYCIEANAEVAARARQEIGWAESAQSIAPGIVEVVEGFSTEVDLPEKVDLLATEIAGSIASEEGVYATIRDAQARFMKRPYVRQLASNPGHRISWHRTRGTASAGIALERCISWGRAGCCCIG